MNVTALIADDEPVARAGMRDMLAAFDWVSIVGEASNGPAAVDAIDALKPELLFLDIQMPGLLGTDVLRKATHQPYVVFTTAYARHAVTAFELGALDYLLKPFGAARLASAMERVRSALGESDAHPPIDRLVEAFGSGPMSRLFVRSGGSLIPVAVGQIAWFDADGDYVVAHAGKSRHMLHLSLNRLEARLDPTKFLRIHRAHIVNLDHVKTFKRSSKGGLEAELLDGTRLPVSRTKAHELRGLGA
ncbi:MAG TPA: LytTR family DNA-binding domain-containing protein [Gemmatimonadaceae bacterium]|nr:LytTR family DNA-binding domain-containing protein [Gemmatimonadaceae bacterium]